MVQLMNPFYILVLTLPGVEIREHFLTRHTFGNLLKSVSLWGVRKTDHRASRSPENGFPALKRGANSSWKHIKMKLTLLRKVLKVVPFTHFFFLCMSSVYSHFEFELTNNGTIFTVSEIQTMRKLYNLTTTSFTGLSLIIIRFNLLEW